MEVIRLFTLFAAIPLFILNLISLRVYIREKKEKEQGRGILIFIILGAWILANLV